MLADPQSGLSTVVLQRRLEVLGTDRVVVPMCEPVSSITSVTLLAAMKGICKSSVVDLQQALDAIPGSTIEFGTNFNSPRQRWFVLPPVAQNCCDIGPDWYAVLRNIEPLPDDEEIFSGCDAFANSTGFCPSPDPLASEASVTPAEQPMAAKKCSVTLKQLIDRIVSKTGGAVSDAFISASDLLAWVGGQIFNNGQYITRVLSNTRPSVIGHNIKVPVDFVGGLKVYLSWLYVNGSGDGMAIKTQATISSTLVGGMPVTVTKNTDIPTDAAIVGAVTETLILELNEGVTSAAIIGLIMETNSPTDPDQRSETIAIVGLRLQFK